VATQRSKTDVVKAILEEASLSDLVDSAIELGLFKDGVVRARSPEITPDWEEGYEPCRNIPVGGTINPPVNQNKSWVIHDSHSFR
jgi:hypothetical protein